MSRLHSYYDRTARNYSLNWAIAIIAIFTFISSLGLFQFLKYLQRGDDFYLLVGPIDFLIGVFGVYRGVHITHAVVRRMIAESPSARPAPISEN
ncbi:MAG TPA: hypothetical protein VKB38_15785 [Terracidiphilus sp.]|nr:hypothetical protein [Terracidiphilus sp.]